MKTLTFKMLGFTSSLLATAGLLSAAEHLDPLTHSAAKQPSISNLTEPPADGCGRNCWYMESAVKDVGAQQR